jgi:aspartyl-tRNA(Asn)/glutamyl-tRNA(Gln) amidotransferase subunit A
MKIAIVKELMSDSVQDDVKSAVMNAANFLESQGAEIREVSMPVLPYAAPAYFCIASAQAVSALSRFDGVKYGLRGEGATYDERLRDSRTRGFGDEVKRRLLLGNYVLCGENMSDYFNKAQAVRQQVIAEFDAVFADCGAIISPTSMRTAFLSDEPSDYVKIYSSTLYTVPMNLAGLPCISVPVGNAGISITAKKFDDTAVLRIARLIEEGGVQS